jgi:hypothetical protein
MIAVASCCGTAPRAIVRRGARSVRARTVNRLERRTLNESGRGGGLAAAPSLALGRVRTRRDPGRYGLNALKASAMSPSVCRRRDGKPALGDYFATSDRAASRMAADPSLRNT